MRGYWSMRVNVEDEDSYKKYAERAKVAIEKFGGKYHVRGGKYKTYDGNDFVRTVVWEFPSYEKAIECHNSKEYLAGWDLAKKTTERHMQVVEGFSTE